MKSVLKSTVNLDWEKVLQNFFPQEKKLLQTWLEDKSFGLNYTRQILELLEDLKRLELRPLEEILKDLDQETRGLSLKGKKRGAALRDWLWERLHPESSQAQKLFLTWMKSLKLDSALQLEAPPHFEGNVFELKIKFKDPQELLRHLKKLQKQIESGLWDTLKEF